MFEQILTLLSKAPPVARSLLGSVVNSAIRSRDPVRVLKAAKAAAAKEAIVVGTAAIVKASKRAR